MKRTCQNCGQLLLQPPSPSDPPYCPVCLHPIEIPPERREFELPWAKLSTGGRIVYAVLLLLGLLVLSAIDQQYDLSGPTKWLWGVVVAVLVLGIITLPAGGNGG